MAQVKTAAKGFLVLASGKIFSGRLFGAPLDAAKNGKIVGPAVAGEVVFNTSLTGYQEILTDPSYQGQIVVMTASHIGNYGVNKEDIESDRVFLSGFVVQELSPIYSNWRASQSLDDYLKEAGIPGLTGVDTRAVTKQLRNVGAANGLLWGDEKTLDQAVKKAKALPGFDGRDLTAEVTSSKSYRWTESSGEWLGEAVAKKDRRFNVVVMDFGVKKNILRCLVDQNCDVTVVPANTPAKDILNLNPDGIVASNGPGDPAAVTHAIKTISDLVTADQARQKQGQKPFSLFGICLGHQLMGLALGGRTYKLKFGHHGANHPIKNLEDGRVDITSQNHGFGVEGEKLSNGEWVVKGNNDVRVTHINLNDEAVEGLRHKTLPVFSVQYHPEASAGPHDARHLFDQFIESMRTAQ